MKKSRDTIRLNWLQKVSTNGGSFSCEQLYDSYTSSPTYGYLPIWEIFTCPSQHVKGSSVRNAIDRAMKVAEKRKGQQ